MKKFELTENFKMNFGKKLFQIRALISIKDVVEAGDTGGYIEKEENLDQSGDAWVSGNAEVYGNARVYGNAWVYGNARVYGNAEVYGDAWVYGNAEVYGDAWVYGNARVSGNAEVYGNARVYGNAEVSGDARVSGNAEVYGDADILQITGLGTVHRTTTVYRTTDGIEIVCGCFRGGIEAFKTQVIDTRNGKVRDEYLKFAELVELYFGIEKKEERENE